MWQYHRASLRGPVLPDFTQHKGVCLPDLFGNPWHDLSVQSAKLTAHQSLTGPMCKENKPLDGLASPAINNNPKETEH